MNIFVRICVIDVLVYKLTDSQGFYQLSTKLKEVKMKFYCVFLFLAVLYIQGSLSVEGMYNSYCIFEAIFEANRKKSVLIFNVIEQLIKLMQTQLDRLAAVVEGATKMLIVKVCVPNKGVPEESVIIQENYFFHIVHVIKLTCVC